jgi:hypothetical protein
VKFAVKSGYCRSLPVYVGELQILRTPQLQIRRLHILQIRASGASLLPAKCSGSHSVAWCEVTVNKDGHQAPPSFPPSFPCSLHSLFPLLSFPHIICEKKIDNCALFAKEFARFEPDEGSGLFLTRGAVCSQRGERFVPNEWPGSGLFPMTGALCSQ